MECYSEQIISLFVDGELEVEEAQRLRGYGLRTARATRSVPKAVRIAR